MIPTRLTFAAVVLLGLSLPSIAAAAPIKLVNHGLTVEMDPTTGAIRSIANPLTGDRHEVRTSAWQLETDQRSIAAPAPVEASPPDPHAARFDYRDGDLTVRLSYSARHPTPIGWKRFSR
jgi:hypothetical protein